MSSDNSDISKKCIMQVTICIS